MKLGIGSYTYSWAMGIPGYDNGRPRIMIDDILDRAVAKGCPAVQICDNAFPDLLTSDERRRIAERADACGLAMQVGTRGIIPGHLRLFLDVAREMDAGLVRSMLPKTGPGSELPEAVAMLKEIMPSYEQESTLLSLENHDRHTCRELREVLERVGSDNLGICLDTVNSFGASEDSRRVADTLLPVANCLHIKDYIIERINTQMGFTVLGAPAGSGTLEIPELLENFAGHYIDGSVILELWTPYINSGDETVDREYRWAEKSLDYLRPFFT